MKNLTKIFMAVVAGMLAFSCVTDITEDQAVQLGADQTTTIGLSLESDVRTHITGKEGEEYPMYWSENDKIAVNGKASEPLAEEYHGEQQAQFTVNALLGYPRAIVYPAPAEGVQAATAGNYPVTFAATQAYTAGTFAEGSVPMYGYVADANAATTLNHLAGVLRLAPYGNATLKALVITAENGKLAGNFDVDTEGNLTAHADATNSVTVTFGEGLTLGATEADAKPIYIAVPAGDYGSVSVTLITDKDSMSMRFNTSGENENGEPKAIKAGKVREFPAFAYEANNAETDEILIYDEASLRNFASRVAEENFDATYPNAKVVANIDLTGKEWDSIEGFAGAFDGGNHEIKGLTAPLFGTTNAASIKNVKLVDVNIQKENIGIVGALACNIDNAAAIVENCSATGNIVVTNLTAANKAIVGGIVAQSNSTQTFSNLHNEVNISLPGTITTEDGKSLIYIGGCVGYLANGSIYNSSNLGNITSENESYSITIRIGGIVSYAKSVIDSTNGAEGTTRGAILLKSEAGQDAQIAGIISLVNKGNITNCHNYASISQYGNGRYTLISGIACQSDADITYSNCTNNGDLCGDIKSICLNMSGIHCQVLFNTTLNNCHNHGALTAKYQRFGGTAVHAVRIGGLITLSTAANNVTITGSAGNECSNTGDIYFTGEYTILYAGGILGCSKAVDSTHFGTLNFTYVKNSGDINIEPTGDAQSMNAYISGIYGFLEAKESVKDDVTIKNATNAGSITINTNLNKLLAGGIMGGSYGTKAVKYGGHITLENVENTKEATISITAKDSSKPLAKATDYPCSVAGIIGYNAYHQSLTINNAKNSADITVKGVSGKDLCIGGLVGYNTSNAITASGEFINEGDIYYEGTTEATGTRLGVGGILGFSNKWTVNPDTATFVNSGDITCNGSALTTAAGGVVGFFTSISMVLKNCSSYATVTAPTGKAGAIAGVTFKIADSRLCHCGGTIEHIDGETITLDKTNYYKHIYPDASTLTPENVVLVYKCGYLSSINAEPAYPAVTPTTDDIFIVNSVETLKEFAAGIAQLKVYFTADIVWPADEVWTPIEGYTGEVHGQGFKITGLNAPFFGTTAATLIDDLHLENVNIVDNEKYRIGALACELNAASVKVSNCSVSGQMSIGYTGTTRMEIGGMIGYVYNAAKVTSTFSNLKSSINITSTSTANAQANYAGVVSYPAYGFVKDCQFTGSITLGENVEHKELNLAGITNFTTKGFVRCINGDKNNPEAGKLSTKAKVAGLLFVGGIFTGTSKGDKVSDPEGINGCINYAPIHVGGQMTSSSHYAYVGGIAGLMHRVSTQVVNCENHGDIEIGLQLTNADNTAVQQFAGIGPLNNASIQTVENCTNYGDITITKEASFNQAPIRVGGVISTTTTHSSGVKFNNLENYGNIYVESKVNKIAESHIGGVVGMVVADTELTNSKSVCNIVAADYTNVGMITGSARDAAAPNVKNCAVGGSICTRIIGEGESGRPDVKYLSATNYFNYIYSSADWAGTSNYDGCTFDSTVVALPE